MKKVFALQNVFRLDMWEEMNGILLNVNVGPNDIQLQFTDGLTIMISDGELARNLQDMVGQNISILKTDIAEKPYVIKIEETQKINSYNKDDRFFSKWEGDIL